MMRWDRASRGGQEEKDDEDEWEAWPTGFHVVFSLSWLGCPAMGQPAAGTGPTGCRGGERCDGEKMRSGPRKGQAGKEQLERRRTAATVRSGTQGHAG